MESAQPQHQYEFTLLPSEFMQVGLRSSPLPYCSLKCCKVDRKDMLVVNSGEQVLVFDLQVTQGQGTSGLVTTFDIQDLLVDEVSSEERKN